MQETQQASFDHFLYCQDTSWNPAGGDVIIGHYTCQTGFPIFPPNHSLVGLEPTRTHPSRRPFIQASAGSKTPRHDLSPTLLLCLLRRSDKICGYPTLSLCHTGSLKSLCSSRASSNGSSSPQVWEPWWHKERVGDSSGHSRCRAPGNNKIEMPS